MTVKEFLESKGIKFEYEHYTYYFRTRNIPENVMIEIEHYCDANSIKTHGILYNDGEIGLALFKEEWMWKDMAEKYREAYHKLADFIKNLPDESTLTEKELYDCYNKLDFKLITKIMNDI